MAKSHNGWKKLSRSGQRKIEAIIRQGERYTLRQFVAADRRRLKGGNYDC
jgi:hypothetical protein